MSYRERPLRTERRFFENAPAVAITIRFEPVVAAGFEVDVQVAIEAGDGPVRLSVGRDDLTEAQRAARERAQREARAITPTGP